MEGDLRKTGYKTSYFHFFCFVSIPHYFQQPSFFKWKIVSITYEVNAYIIVWCTLHALNVQKHFEETIAELTVIYPAHFEDV